MTASLRFEGEMNVDLNEFQTNLVPFPRLHFMTTSMAPVLTPEKAETEKNDVQSISAVSYTHLRAHETSLHLVCRLLLEKKNKKQTKKKIKTTKLYKK